MEPLNLNIPRNLQGDDMLTRGEKGVKRLEGVALLLGAITLGQLLILAALLVWAKWVFI